MFSLDPRSPLDLGILFFGLDSVRLAGYSNDLATCCAIHLCVGSLTCFDSKNRDFSAMKDGIHPKYNEATVTCGCGTSFITRSTRPKIMVEVCSKCHPFFTGTVKFLDTAGRVDRFNKKFQGTYGKAKKKGAEEPAQA